MKPQLIFLPRNLGGRFPPNRKAMMHATPIEDHERLERAHNVLVDEVINFLEVMSLTDDPKTIAAAAQLGLETLKSMEGRVSFRPDFEMEWEVGPDVEIRFEPESEASEDDAA